MKKTLVACLASAILLVTSSAAFAANWQGKIGGFYSVGSYEDNKRNYDEDYKPLGIKLEASCNDRWGIDGCWRHGGLVDSDTHFCGFDINATYKLIEDNAARLDVSLGYLHVTKEDMVISGIVNDMNYSGFSVGLKGEYDLGSKFVLNGKLAYAPSLKAKHGDDEVDDFDGNALKYELGVSYELDKKYTVDAGYQGINLGGDDEDIKTGGLYAGFSMKF